MKFLLFNSVKLVKGVKNSLLIDTQRNEYYIINKDYFNILEALDIFTIEEVTRDCSEEDKKVVIGFVENMCNEEFGFLTEFNESFSKKNLQDNILTFCYPVTTSIVEVKRNNLSIVKSTLRQIINLGCPFIEIRCLDTLKTKELHRILCVLENSSVTAINIIIPYSNELGDKNIIASLCKQHYRVNDIVISNSPFIKTEKERLYSVRYIQRDVTSLHCGLVGKEKFHSNVLFYNESTSWNTCLNKKLSIDSMGNIKNCPSMPESFGNIKDTTLQEAIEKPGFKKYWDITKDKIHVCKDCEFRYICTDCRAYIEDPEDIYSKPLKCGYNPYTGEWSEWSTNPLKEKAIDFYGMRDII